MFGVIGGSGLYQLEGLVEYERLLANTGYGEASGPVVSGHIDGGEILFIARHGEDHSIAPHRINYRANLKALEKAGATRILGISTAGGIGNDCHPGSIVVPDQIIDYTWGREHSFVEAGTPVNHVDFTWPYSPDWRERVLQELGAVASGAGAVVNGGTLAVTQGPRLESAAEVARLARDGCDLVSMTGMPEAALARELGIDFAAVCPVANRAAGLAGGEIDPEEMVRVVRSTMASVTQLISNLASAN